MSQAMTVGELSRQTGVPAKALREYTDWGLIYTLGRSSTNYRLYQPAALWCVQTIKQLRSLGLTLAEIRELPSIFDGGGPAAAAAWLADRLRVARARIDAQIRTLEHTRARIDLFEAAHRDELACRCGTQLWADAPQPPAA
jgi:MerR family copper efflux transcriptional regulator